ncbi:MAG: hypothetical protein AVDCRST_MAG07-2908, partial [uncultured Frankineae bacterium]
CLSRLVARGCLALVHGPPSGGASSARWRWSVCPLYADAGRSARPWC